MSVHLRNYWNAKLPDLIEFGFILDFKRYFQLQSTFRSHASALEYHDHVDAHINEELQCKALYGPVTEPPFPVHISPLMIREKQNSCNNGPELA